MNSWVFDVTDSDFETSVLDRSKERPVVVDFWAPWCGPCRVLSPVLEALTEEYEGKLLLAKVNVDENPGLASIFKIQGIPAIKIFKDGDTIAEFVGVLPESDIREILSTVVPSALDEMAADGERKAEAGETDVARSLLERVLEESPNHPRALLAMGRLLMESDPDEAVSLLERISISTPERKEADLLIARNSLSQGDGGDITGLKAQVASNPEDVGLRFSLAKSLAAAEDYEAALKEFLLVLSQDRSLEDDGARKAMIQIFEVLGPGSELAERYRSEMAKVLFR
jgi:putative thioredoxin